MKTVCGWAVAALMLAGCVPAGREGEANGNGHLEKGLLQIEVHRKRYDLRMPWSAERVRTSKNGVAMAGRQILTTADDLDGHVFSRVQKESDGKWWDAKLAWVDYPSNLALLEVEDEAFWEGVSELELARGVPLEGSAQILRWQDGRVERWLAQIDRPVVARGQMSYAEHLQLQLTSKIPGAGWAEAVVRKGELLGLTTSVRDEVLTVMPSAFIRDILQARKEGRYHGLGFFDFVWQTSVNEATRKLLGLGETQGGVLINEAGRRTRDGSPFRPRDVLLEVDGHAINREGLYDDPLYGRLPLDNLSTSGRMAGDVVRMKVWRDGAGQEIEYTLPPVAYDNRPVPDALYDREPEYLVAGGLMFLPLSMDYLRLFGNNAPFILNYYNVKSTYQELGREGLVVLAGVLADPYNLGYEEMGNSLVDRVNGRKVGTMAELVEALRHPQGRVHVIEFFEEFPVRRMILDAGDLEQATRRVLQRYNIPQDRVIRGDPAVRPGA